MTYAIAQHMRDLGVTVVMTVETEQQLGTAQIGAQGVSFVADNLVQLRYVELDGRLERALSVIKARGVQHVTELRSLVIGADGLHVVAGRFADLRGVLTGFPAREPRLV
jgi:circadian clock protein KaiC